MKVSTFADYVARTEREDRRAAQAIAEQAMSGPATAVGGPPVHLHRHFRGRRAGREVFVKVMTDLDGWERALGAAVVERVWPSTPRLVGAGPAAPGDLVGGHRAYWLAYQWAELTPAPATPAVAEQVGELTGRLHAATADPGEECPAIDLDGQIRDRIDRLRQSPLPGLADPVRDLHERLGPTQLPDDRVCRIHGDLSWHNIALDEHGQAVLLDLEASGAAHPLLDLGKLVHHGDMHGELLDAFAAGYARAAQPVIPWPEPAMRHIILWIVTADLVHALGNRGQHDLLEHSIATLNRMRHEAFLD